MEEIADEGMAEAVAEGVVTKLESLTPEGWAEEGPNENDERWTTEDGEGGLGASQVNTPFDMPKIVSPGKCSVQA